MGRIPPLEPRQDIGSAWIGEVLGVSLIGGRAIVNLHAEDGSARVPQGAPMTLEDVLVMIP
jgi:hypothetical protein